MRRYLNARLILALRALGLVAGLLALTQGALAVGPVQSSPITLTPNNSILLCVNPDANSLSLYNPATGGRLADVAVGRDPASVAATNTTAYVANALDGTVSVINLTTRKVTSTLAVGIEPLALVLSPNGTRLYVANSASSSVTVLDTANNTIVATVDLSASGTAPRALAVTNNNDANDTDETILVAMFFAQLRPGKTATDEGQDDQREGRVVAISAATNTILGTAVLAPMDKTFNGNLGTGFNANGQLAPATGTTPAIASLNPQAFTTPTGAYTNQLAAVAIHPSNGMTYVVSTGASPNGPVRFNHMNQGLVSVFNTSTRAEVRSGQTAPSVRQTAPLNMNQGVNLSTTPAPRFFLTNPVAMAWRPDGSDAWVVIQNSDLVVRLTVDAGGIPTASTPLVAGPSNIVRVDLQSVAANQIAGKAARGIAINNAGTRAFVFNFVSRSITMIDISNPTAPSILSTFRASALPIAGSLEATALRGAELFFTGRGPQERMSSESWGGCIVCHPRGLTDNVTWMFDAGPRQTIPLDSTFSRTNPADQRVLNWSGVRDEIHDFELNTRGVFGGRGLIDNDRLFLAVGGTSGTTPADSGLIEQFQQFTGATSKNNDLTGATLPALTTPRRDFAMATLEDGRIFIIGGRTRPGQGDLISGTGAILEFNPRTNVLRSRNSLGFTPRHSLGAAAVRTNQGFRVYAVGGYTSATAATAPTGLVQEYNPQTDTWRTVASLPTAVAQFGITVAGGINTAEPLQLIHVVSGNGSSEAAPSVVGGGSIVQRFQPAPTGPGTWSAFSVTGLTPRRNHGAATALRGVQSRIFIVGGQDAGGTVLATVEEYAAQAVVAIGPTTPPGAPFFGPHPPRTSLPAARARFGIGHTLTTNQIYVMGGVDGAGADQTTVFEYSVANNTASGVPGTPTGSWVIRSNLSAARRGLQVSTPAPVTNFLPVRNAGRNANQDSIATWTALKVRSSRAPVPATDPGAQAGRTLFGQTGLVIAGFSCATCHGGQRWTRSKVDYNAPPSAEVGLGLGNERVIGAELRQTKTQPNQSTPPFAAGTFPGVLINVGTFSAGGRANEVRANAADISQPIAPLGANGFNIPSLLSVHETAPYFYSGLAQTLDQVLDGSQDGNGGTRHHFVTSAADRANLIQFLRSIDQTTPIFP